MDAKGDKVCRKYYEEFIEKRQDLKRTSSANTTTARTQNPCRTQKKVKLVGRRVVMSADVFGGSPDRLYQGLVICVSKYKQGGKMKHGYKVK